MLQDEVILQLRLIAKLLFTFLFAVSFAYVSAQEICDNGKDDDRDGLIDLKDPDCQRRWKAPENILLNPSFELFKHCPTDGYPYDENYNVAENWQYGVMPNGDIGFYHNLSFKTDSDAISTAYHPNFPYLTEGDLY
jgi:hypothetical protein